MEKGESGSQAIAVVYTKYAGDLDQEVEEERAVTVEWKLRTVVGDIRIVFPGFI